MKMKTLQRDQKRDKELIKDYKSGTAMYKLNGKYEISSTRIYQILDFYKVPRRTAKK